MQRLFRNILILAFLSFFCAAEVYSQSTLRKQIGDTLTAIANQSMWVGNVSVRNFSADKNKKRIIITTNETLGYLSFRESNVAQIYGAIEAVLPAEYKNYKIECKIGDRYSIEDLIPNYYRTEIDEDNKRRFRTEINDAPLLTNISKPNKITNGLQNKHLAVWQSHGLYYNQTQVYWSWQRARLMQTVEDLYTQAYVLPFLVPMLENAGANVLLPRERDVQTAEIIVDNDDRVSHSKYKEIKGKYKWEAGVGAGFAHEKEMYVHGENPFQMGTYKSIQSVQDENDVSLIEWIPAISKAGSYAVYVSYKTENNSAPDAHYTVYHQGGKTEFLVNQTMGGGTWIYLGHFEFEPDDVLNGKVVLSNLSSGEKRTVTADAVKLGGGMGNIARQPFMPDPKYKPSAKKKSNSNKEPVPYIPVPEYTSEISTYPRFAEGARYWLQWAGMPDTVYSPTGGANDYQDDYRARGNWVNYISGGSAVQPNRQGLNIPVELAVAFHSDAGVTSNDSVIGTLAICSTYSEEKDLYNNSVRRMAARDLTDIIQTQIIEDIRCTFAPEWTLRGIWDKQYYESRVPQVPAILLESMSHQNFADMRYGNDPRFRFVFSRAIYKGILKYMESVYDEEFIVQPLPVENFNIRFINNNHIELSWEPVIDSLEHSAAARQYIVYTKLEDEGFDNGKLIDVNSYQIKIEPDEIYSFKVTAVNEGGESFPSEVLSVSHSSKNRGRVLIVNAFDRVSAPAGFMKDSTMAGFLNQVDAGMPYLYDISFTGEQYEFNRSEPWVSDDAPGFGASHAQYEQQVIAGNTFDYPYLHGKAIKEAGYSFISGSKGAVLSGKVDMNDYKLVDLILGSQKQTFIGNGQKPADFKTFPLDLQEKIQSYCSNGGSIFVSGSYIASDMSDKNDNGSDKVFIEQVLKYKLLTGKGAVKGKAKSIKNNSGYFKNMEFSFYDEPNENSYYVLLPDAIQPIDKNGFIFCRYGENNLSSGIAYRDKKYKVCALSFPFETIKEENGRNELMKSILTFLNSK